MQTRDPPFPLCYYPDFPFPKHPSSFPLPPNNAPHFPSLPHLRRRRSQVSLPAHPAGEGHVVDPSMRGTRVALMLVVVGGAATFEQADPPAWWVEGPAVVVHGREDVGQEIVDYYGMELHQR